MEEAADLRRDLAQPLGAGDALFPFGGVFAFESIENSLSSGVDDGRGGSGGIT